MNSVIADILKEAQPRSLDEHMRTLREILQQVALLGLWGKEFVGRPTAVWDGKAQGIATGGNRD
jgi:hypothetical protein